MTLPSLIALYAPCMGSGKSTVSQVLTTEYGYTTTKFAQALKDMIASLLYNVGLDPDDVERCIEGDMKEVVLPEIGCSPRRLMQTLGREWGQEYIHPNLWVNITTKYIKGVLRSGGKVVVDDLRYPQEYDALKDLGAVFVKVVRPEATRQVSHYSEGILDQKKFDFGIINKDGLGELKQSVRDYLSYFA